MFGIKIRKSAYESGWIEVIGSGRFARGMAYRNGYARLAYFPQNYTESQRSQAFHPREEG